jgi:hypothetical protein
MTYFHAAAHIKKIKTADARSAPFCEKANSLFRDPNTILTAK